jgi:hypothetical protein
MNVEHSELQLTARSQRRIATLAPEGMSSLSPDGIGAALLGKLGFLKVEILMYKIFARGNCTSSWYLALIFAHNALAAVLCSFIPLRNLI